jgi:hypothetical protein
MPPSSLARPAVLAAVVVVPTVVACSGDVTIAPSDETRSLAAAAESAKTWAPSEAEPVTLHLDVPSTVRRGARVPIRVTLHNGSTRPVAIGFDKTQGFDVIVARMGMPADSGPVWSRMKLEQFGTDVTITDPLRAGRDTTFTAIWPGTDDLGHIVPTGHYRLRATVQASLLETRQMWTPWVPVEVQSTP